jgi:hypothetical protein
VPYPYRFIAFISCLFLLITPAFSQSDCALRKDKDGVRVYTCLVEHNKFKSIKASFDVQATPTQLIDIVFNPNDYNSWQYHTINAHVLQRKSETELIYYTEIVSPWPASNRDLIVHLRIEHDKATRNIKVYANSIPEYIPRKDGIVRVPMSKSQWTVKPINESTLHVEFTMLVDPGGSVPAWLINMVAAEAPYESFRNFKNKIEKVN